MNIYPLDNFFIQLKGNLKTFINYHSFIRRRFHKLFYRCLNTIAIIYKHPHPINLPLTPFQAIPTVSIKIGSIFNPNNNLHLMKLKAKKRKREKLHPSKCWRLADYLHQFSLFLILTSNKRNFSINFSFYRESLFASSFFASILHFMLAMLHCSCTCYTKWDWINSLRILNVSQLERKKFSRTEEGRKVLCEGHDEWWRMNFFMFEY